MSFDLRAAYDATPDHGILQLPPERINIPVGGLVIDKQITIRGTSPAFDRLQGGTILGVDVNYGADAMLTIANRNIALEDLILDGKPLPNELPKALFGILAHPAEVRGHLRIERVDVWRCFVGIKVSLTNNLRIYDSGAKACVSSGLEIDRSTVAIVRGGLFSGNGGAGIRMLPSGGSRIRDVSFEANCQKGAYAQLEIEQESAHIVEGCIFEDFAQNGSQTAIHIDGTKGATIRDCTFVQPDLRPCTGIAFAADATGRVENCCWKNVSRRIDDGRLSAINIGAQTIL